MPVKLSLPLLYGRTAMSTEDRDAVIRKINALMAKADSTGFEAEAEALAAKAQELMARYLIDHGDLGDTELDRPVMREVAVAGRYANARQGLLMRIATINGVFTHTWYLGDDRAVRMFGRPATIDQVCTLFAVLDTQLLRHLPSVGVGRPDVRSFRHAFIVGFNQAVTARLRRKLHEVEQDSPGVGLVLVDRRSEGEALWQELNPGMRLRSTSTSLSNVAGYIAGDAAGSRADLGGARFSGRAALGRGA